MSLPRQYARILRKNFRMHPVWLPLSSQVDLGDFGVWRGGVFTPLGNVREFGAKPEIVDGEPVQLDFQSNGVVIADANVSGGAKVKQAIDADAQLSIQCADAESFILQAPVLTSKRIDNVAAVAAMINRNDGKNGLKWRTRYKFVAEVYTGEQVTILATSEAKTTITLSGEAKDPRELLKGALDAKLSADKSMGLTLVGAKGAVGLRLVRIGVSGVGVTFSGGGDDEAAEPTEEATPSVIAEDAWDHDPDDDPEHDDDEGAAR